MNSCQIKLLSVFTVFAIIGFGPVSPGCLIGMYIVWMRPEWFSKLIDGMYDYPGNIADTTVKNARIKCLLGLLILFIIDIAPVPVTPVIAFFVILGKPEWFYRMVKNVYAES